MFAQGTTGRTGPPLPAEVLVAHVLPRLSDAMLASAACTDRAWRAMAGEVFAARRAAVRKLLGARRQAHTPHLVTAARTCKGLRRCRRREHPAPKARTSCSPVS